MLSLAELEMLEQPFVQFLATQGIDAALWTSIKSTDDDRLNQLIVSFSDFIFDQTLRQNLFLQRISKSTILCLHCQKNKIITVQLHSDDPEVDFQTMDLFERSIYQSNKNFTISLGDQAYSNADRSNSIFELIESGYSIGDGALYKLLCLLYAA